VVSVLLELVELPDPLPELLDVLELLPLLELPLPELLPLPEDPEVED
jgi:hypothetical protein